MKRGWGSLRMPEKSLSGAGIGKNPSFMKGVSGQGGALRAYDQGPNIRGGENQSPHFLGRKKRKKTSSAKPHYKPKKKNPPTLQGERGRRLSEGEKMWSVKKKKRGVLREKGTLRRDKRPWRLWKRKRCGYRKNDSKERKGVSIIWGPMGRCLVFQPEGKEERRSFVFKQRGEVSAKKPVHTERQPAKEWPPVVQRKLGTKEEIGCVAFTLP